MRLPFAGNFRVSQIFGNDLIINGVHIYAQYGYKGHNGIDYATPSGTTILAPHSGKVIEANFDANGYGYYLKIENDVEGSVLGHNQKFLVKVGDIVTEGQPVAISGNTGNSTGAHLHWGYYKFPRNRQNGYGGFIDQAPLLVSTTPMPGNMYGTPNAYDLSNIESMKIVVDAFNDFMTPGKYMKVADSEVLLNQQKNDYEIKLQNVNTQNSNLTANIMGFAVLLGLSKEANPDEVMKAIKALQDKIIELGEDVGTVTGTLPETIQLNGDQWGLKEVNLIDGKMQGNYQRL